MNKKGKVIFCLTEIVPISSNSSSSSSSDSSDDNKQSYILSDDSWVEETIKDDPIFFSLMQGLIFGNRRNRVQNYVHLVESWTNIEFQEHLRLRRNTVYQLVDDIQESGFIPQNSFGMKPITAKVSVFIFLWFMANTEPLRTIADRFDVSISSVFRVVRRVWLLTKLNDVIKWPQGHNITTISNDFFLLKNIPNVIGAIDCSHIRIEKPPDNESHYCNRKKYFSLNLQAVVDSKTRFTNVYCGEPGSLHDARVLRRSPLHSIASREQERVFPNNTFILGDSAYPSLPWLVPPFRDNGHLTPQQREFNYLHSSTRMSVERAFGLLKGRFRRIKFFNEYKTISFVTDITIAACILHNYCINANDDLDIMEDDNELIVNNNHDNPEENIPNEIAQDRRMHLFNELFPEM
ncbi:putative nuclease HARBI1 [Solenopsis invicta]|uniref:putative nuclease HARBI1 n=1 Tax=Solenopsis invicta TaxID=13686 RepID=UPI00193DC062|nr:putative nuclease HARBI1 [Solenopsis invicta]